MLDLRQADQAVTLRVRVQPRASRDALQGERAGALVVRLQAPPVEGAANVALQRLLARALGVAPPRVELLRGATGRDKLVRLHGLTVAAVRLALDESPEVRGSEGRKLPASTPRPNLLRALPDDGVGVRGSGARQPAASTRRAH